MELQAVVMAAGPGSRVTDLTIKTPKALLPIANMPMIWYPVQMLERAGFQEAIVVVLDSTRADIQKALEEICDTKLHLEFVTIPEEEDWGTADTLRHIRDKIKTDVLVVSCDLVTDLSLHLLVDVHRTYDATVTMLLAPAPDITDVSVPGGKGNRKQERQFIGLDENGHRVLFVGAEADFERSLTIKKSLFKRHPYIDMHTRLVDSHLYLMKRWTLDILAQESSISTIKGEFIPYLVKRQMSRPAASKTETDTPNTSTLLTDSKNDTNHLPEDNNFATLAQEYSTWNDHHGDMDDCYHGDKIKCYAYKMDGGFCLRANNVHTYCETNKQVPRQMSLLAPGKDLPLVHPTAITHLRTVGADSMVGEGSTIADKANVKRSVIGKHCTVGEKCKINNSVIMDYVTIQEGSTVNGCVVCQNAHLGERCELKECIVGTSQNVVSLGKYTNEVLLEMEQMMEIDY